MARPSIMKDSSRLTDWQGLQYDLSNYRWQIVIEVQGKKYAFGSYVMDDVAARGHDFIMQMMGRQPVNNSDADMTSPEVQKLVGDVRDRLDSVVDLKAFLKLASFMPDLVNRISHEPYRARIRQIRVPSEIEKFIAENGDLEMYFQPRLKAWCGIAVTKRLSSLCVYTSQPFGPEWGGR